jgi:hypothetical protein
MSLSSHLRVGTASLLANRFPNTKTLAVPDTNVSRPELKVVPERGAAISIASSFRPLPIMQKICDRNRLRA